MCEAMPPSPPLPLPARLLRPLFGAHGSPSPDLGGRVLGPGHQMLASPAEPRHRYPKPPLTTAQRHHVAPLTSRPSTICRYSRGAARLKTVIWVGDGLACDCGRMAA